MENGRRRMVVPFYSFCNFFLGGGIFLNKASFASASSNKSMTDLQGNYLAQTTVQTLKIGSRKSALLYDCFTKSSVACIASKRFNRILCAKAERRVFCFLLSPQPLC